jgi:hypothetical protein
MSCSRRVHSTDSIDDVIVHHPKMMISMCSIHAKKRLERNFVLLRETIVISVKRFPMMHSFYFFF